MLNRLSFLRCLFCLAGLLFLSAPLTALDTGDIAEIEGVNVCLVSESPHICPGSTTWIGLQFSLPKATHLYWKNPGDSGMPPAFTLSLPPGFRAGEFQWPVPTRYVQDREVLYGYEQQVLFLCDIRVPASATLNESVILRADVNALLCADACVPFRASVELPLLVASPTPALDPQTIEIFTEGRRRLPLAAEAWAFRATPTPDRYWNIEMHAPPDASLPESVFLIPEVSDVIDDHVPQSFQPGTATRSAILRVKRGHADPGIVIHGLLIASGTRFVVSNTSADALSIRILVDPTPPQVEVTR